MGRATDSLYAASRRWIQVGANVHRLPAAVLLAASKCPAPTSGGTVGAAFSNSGGWVAQQTPCTPPVGGAPKLAHMSTAYRLRYCWPHSNVQRLPAAVLLAQPLITAGDGSRNRLTVRRQ